MEEGKCWLVTNLLHVVNVTWENVEAYTNIDEAYQHCKSLLFMNVCDKHCPIVSRCENKTFIPWIDHIDAEINEELRLEHMYHNKAQKQNLNIYWDLYKNFWNSVANMIKQARKSYYVNLILKE